MNAEPFSISILYQTHFSLSKRIHKNCWFQCTNKLLNSSAPWVLTDWVPVRYPTSERFICTKYPLPCQKDSPKGQKKGSMLWQKRSTLRPHGSSADLWLPSRKGLVPKSLYELTINRKMGFSLLLVHLLISINTNVLVGAGTEFITNSCLSKFWHVWRSCAWCLSTNQGPHEGNFREGEFCHFCRGAKLLLHHCFASLVFFFLKLLFLFSINPYSSSRLNANFKYIERHAPNLLTNCRFNSQLNQGDLHDN